MLQLITGLLIVGESLALYIGMSYKKSSWVNPVNNSFVVFDLVIGALLIASSIGVSPPQIILLITSTLTHVLRDYDYYKRVPDRYAFNVPLLVLLNVRLLMLVAILFQ